MVRTRLGQAVQFSKHETRLGTGVAVALMCWTGFVAPVHRQQKRQVRMLTVLCACQLACLHEQELALISSRPDTCQLLAQGFCKLHASH